MTYRIIGIMTGNSMDAIDLVLTEFDGDRMTDVCSFSKPYTKKMQAQIENLRNKVVGKTKKEKSETEPLHLIKIFILRM